MQTDERPPPWYDRLVPATLKRAWETVKTDWRAAKQEAERQDPWHVRIHEEMVSISWEALRGGIPHDEGMRLYREAEERRDTLLSPLRAPPSADDPVTYDGSVPRVVGAVMRWLCTRKDAVVPVTRTGVLAVLPQFAVEK